MTQDINDLIARLEKREVARFAHSPGDTVKPPFYVPDPDCQLAAAALREQRDEIARLTKLTEPNQIDWAARCGRAEAEIERLKDECERERIRLAACGAAALGYHKDGDSIHSDYTSASLSDVHALVAKLEKAEAEVARLTALCSHAGLLKAQEEHNKVVAERDAAMKDAERYRWLRYRMNSAETESLPSGINLDRAIDAAMSKEKP